MIDPSALKSIEDLHRLKTEGIITDSEFEQAKERLLFGKHQGAKPAASTFAALTTSPECLPAIDDHLGWITLPLKRYADFNGRSGRKEFWMFQILPLGAVLLTFFVLADGVTGYGEFKPLNGFLLLPLGLAMLALVVPQLAVQARRLHDQNRSGWLALLNLLPYVGWLIVFILMLMEGTPGPNRYGDDPRQATH